MLLYDTGTGYACMKKIESLLKSNQHISFDCQKWHFAFPNEFQPKYGLKHDDRIGFKPILEEALPYGPFETCGRIQLIIRTIKNL